MHWRPDPRRLVVRSGRSAAIYAGRALLTLSIAFGGLSAQLTWKIHIRARVDLDSQSWIY